MKFFTDVQAPKQIAPQLRSRGIDTIHASEVGLDNEADEVLLNYAVSNKRTMISCDRDFSELHYNYIAAAVKHYGIIQFKMSVNCNISAIVNEVLDIVALVESDDEMHNQLWEVK